MPELPEVETIVRGLSNAIVRKTITSATVRLSRLSISIFDSVLAGKFAEDAILSVSRRAKYIVSTYPAAAA